MSEVPWQQTKVACRFLFTAPKDAAGAIYRVSEKKCRKAGKQDFSALSHPTCLNVLPEYQ
jgi:hypothetical protein